MTTAVLPEAGSEPIAPGWHSALLLAFFVLTAAFGAVLQHNARARAGLFEGRPDVIPLYLSLIAMEWGLVYFVWKGGLRPRGLRMRDFIGARWTRRRPLWSD